MRLVAHWFCTSNGLAALIEIIAIDYVLCARFLKAAAGSIRTFTGLDVLVLQGHSMLASVLGTRQYAKMSRGANSFDADICTWDTSTVVSVRFMIRQHSEYGASGGEAIYPSALSSRDVASHECPNANSGMNWKSSGASMPRAAESSPQRGWLASLLVHLFACS